MHEEDVTDDVWGKSISGRASNALQHSCGEQTVERLCFSGPDGHDGEDQHAEENDGSSTECVTQWNPEDVCGSEHKTVDGDEMGKVCEGDDTGWWASLGEDCPCCDEVWQCAADDRTGNVGDSGVERHESENGEFTSHGEVERISRVGRRLWLKMDVFLIVFMMTGGSSHELVV